LIRVNQQDRSVSDKERLLRAIDDSEKRITVIVGLSKNAGKTTFLNWLMEKSSFAVKGVITTGRDGEDLDILEKVRKPRVSIPVGTIFTVRACELQRLSGFLEVLEKLPFKAGGENIWLVRTDTTLEVEIVGPPSVVEQIETARRILSHGAEHVFIDGSLDRKAIGSSPLVDSLIITGSPVIGALPVLKKGYKNLYDLTGIEEATGLLTADKLEGLRSEDHIRILFNPLKKSIRDRKQEDKIGDELVGELLVKSPEWVRLPFKTLLGHEKELLNLLKSKGRRPFLIYVPGSLTERSFQLLKGTIQELPGLKIIVKHPFHIQVTEQSLHWLKQKNLLLTLKRMEIAGLIVNSFAVNGNHIDCEQFRRSIREEFHLPVVDVMEVSE